MLQDDKLKELESLAATLMDSHESPEAWVAYAFLAKCQRKSDKALYFAQKVRLLIMLRCCCTIRFFLLERCASFPFIRFFCLLWLLSSTLRDLYSMSFSERLHMKIMNR